MIISRFSTFLLELIAKPSAYVAIFMAEERLYNGQKIMCKRCTNVDVRALYN